MNLSRTSSAQVSDLRISVALCTLNGAKYIADQIHSILNQTLPIAELIVADDGSDDRTIDIALAAARGAAKSGTLILRVLPPEAESLGFVKNFERALRECTGEVVVLADQDDVWLPYRVERALGILKDASVQVVVSDAYLIDSSSYELRHTFFRRNGKPAVHIQDGIVKPQLNSLVRRNRFPGMTMMIRRGFLDHVLPVPAGWHHDYWIALFAASQDALALIEQPLISYRLHSANTVGLSAYRFSPIFSRAWAVLLRKRSSPRTSSSRWEDDISHRLEPWANAQSHQKILLKIELEKYRSTLSKNLFRRFVGITRHSRSYALLSRNGVLTALNDLVR